MNKQQLFVQKIAKKLARGKAEGMFSSTLNVRNEEGVMQTFSRILETASNYFFEDPNGQRDPARATLSFSNNSARAMGSALGVSGATQETMDAIDISIAASVFSLIPYLAIERDMTASSTSISYQDLIAEKAHGDLSEGEVVMGTFVAPNSKVNLALPTKTATEAGAGANLSIALQSPLMPESVSVVVKNSTGDVLATGFDRGGVLYFTGSVSYPGTVNYKTGAVVLDTVTSGNVVTVLANVDSTADSTGDSILTVTAAYKTTVLTASPQQLIFKDNNLKNAYLNKLNVKLAGTDAAIDYGAMAIGKLITIYVQYVDRLIVNATLAAGNATASGYGVNELTADISTYGVGVSFADTKYDIIKNLIIELNQKSLDATGRGITCILTSSRGVNKLAASPDFVKSAEFNELNAMVGTYDGIPVLRHQNVGAQEPIDGKSAYYYGIYKDPSGNSAPIAFGEFLPVTTTAPVANFNNPNQVAQSMTSFCGVVQIVPELCNRAKLTFLA